jgi:hypothetical protein
MSEEDLAGGAAPGGGNRTFLIAAGLMGVPLILAVLGLLIFVLPNLGRQAAGTVDPAATQAAAAGEAATAVAISQLTQQAVSPTPKPANTATPKPSPTRVLIATPTRAALASDTPPVNRGSATAFPTPTRIGGGAPPPTPTPSGLPNGGFGSESGGPLILLAGLGLLGIILGARRLRSG